MARRISTSTESTALTAFYIFVNTMDGGSFLSSSRRLTACTCALPWHGLHACALRSDSTYSAHSTLPSNAACNTRLRPRRRGAGADSHGPSVVLLLLTAASAVKLPTATSPCQQHTQKAKTP